MGLCLYRRTLDLGPLYLFGSPILPSDVDKVCNHAVNPIVVAVPCSLGVMMQYLEEPFIVGI